jgi:hypothetical protein
MADQTVRQFEHAGLTVRLVDDDDFDRTSPFENDNAGTIYSWTRDFDGDESIWCRDTVGGKPYALAGADNPNDLSSYFAANHDAVLTLPLRYEDWGASGARLRISDADSANAVLVFTQADLDREWSGSVDDATMYAEGRVRELDNWLQGNVFGIVVEHDLGEAPMACDSVWGFIGDPWSDGDWEWFQSEGRAIAADVRDSIDYEEAERERWACADVITI